MTSTQRRQLAEPRLTIAQASSTKYTEGVTRESELTACPIRGLLLADVRSDLLQFEPDGGYSVTAGPEVFGSALSR